MNKVIVNGYGMVPASSNGWGCVCCGHPINKGELMADCPDCGGIFCRTCVEDGNFENHDCEEFEED